MADSGPRNSTQLSTVILVVISILFAATAIVQFVWTGKLQKKYEQSQMELVRLKTECLQYSLQNEGDIPLELNREQPESLEEMSKGRHQRDLQQMLTDMMVAQEKVLLSHCLNGTAKLCIPGPKGDPGLNGAPGIQGPPGTPGTAGTFGAKGDTGPAGLKGTKGDAGVKGEPGIKGNYGEKGEPGPKGDAGVKGQKGDLGSQGPRGLPGLKGEKGDTGLQGVAGSQGPAGLKGDKGDQGIRGPKGDKGTDGLKGSSGTQLQNDCLCIKSPKIDVFEPQNETVYYPLGSSVRLRCDSTSTNPAPTVTWTLPSPNPCITTTGSTLVLNSLQPTEVGNYTCTVSNQYGTASKTFVIKSDGLTAVSCDFEKNDLCLWKTNQSSVGTWSVKKGPTQTSNTGPDTDHTKGNRNGVYAYIESSFDGSGANAYLVSPEVPATGQACFTFWYNMHGSNIGSLVLEKVERLPDCSERIQTMATLSGDQGNVWHEAQINLPNTVNPYRLVLKSIRVAGVYGDTAIDDLDYSVGKCKPNLKLNGPSEVFMTVSANSPVRMYCNVSSSTTPTISWKKLNSCGGTVSSTTNANLLETVHANSGDTGTYVCTASSGPSASVTQTFHVTVNNTGFDDKCTFDTGSYCGWEQLTSDNFNWTIHSGSTQSDGTGPTADHTATSANRQYIYIETSSPRSPGEYAEISSHLLPANQTKCLDLWYYMYGPETGNLKVYLEDQCSHQRTEIFKESGEKGQKWNHGFVSIPGASVPNDYKIIIRGDVGSSYHGDTALDDIHIRDSACADVNANSSRNGQTTLFTTSAIDCDFTHDFCQWKQSTTDDFNWTRLTGSTVSSNTGPSGDHTTAGGRGYYIYTEGSSPQSRGDTAVLTSPSLPAGQDFCFSLATNMYGDTMGSIAVIIEDISGSGGGQQTLATYSTGDTVEHWQERSVYIPAQRNGFRILLQGVVGSGFATDAAIDDVSVHTGKC